MKKSGDEVLEDVRNLLKGSELISMLSGKLCEDASHRDLNSTKEDAVLIFKAGLDGQIQEGAVTLHIYVPDQDLGFGGKSKYTARTKAISKKANEEFGKSRLIGEYRFKLGNMVQTYKAEPPDQHFVSLDLRFRRTTF